MNTADLSSIVVGMSGLMPETSRTELAVRLAQLIEHGICQDLDAMQHWANGGLTRFLSDCQLTTTARPVVPFDFAVEESKLAEFCNRWLSVDKYKLADEPDDTLRPITVEMNSLRVSMVNELKALAGLAVNELPREVQDATE